MPLLDPAGQSMLVEPREQQVRPGDIGPRLQRQPPRPAVRARTPVLGEVAVFGKIVATGVPYDSRRISVITLEKGKIVHWRDCIDSLAPWLALRAGR
jgi:ketosteroid isomerase-like protein